VSAKVVRRATARPVCDALAEAMRAHGIPDQILTDNGKVFTGRFGREQVPDLRRTRLLTAGSAVGAVRGIEGSAGRVPIWGAWTLLGLVATAALLVDVCPGEHGASVHRR
jgi:transposase InsO family protein